MLDKAVPAGWGYGRTLRIGNELITFSSSDARGNLSGVVRGAYGTVAAAHRQSARVSHLREMFGLLPDPASDLLEEIGAKLAAVVDQVDADYVYFDGLEALSIWGLSTMARFHRAFWKLVKRRDIIVQSSGNSGQVRIGINHSLSLLFARA